MRPASACDAETREVIIGRITETTYIEPTGYVDSVAVRFYPYGFTDFVRTPLEALANTETLTEIAYESEYYDRAHFIKDFKEFTGTTPKRFLGSEQMALSSLLYK